MQTVPVLLLSTIVVLWKKGWSAKTGVLEPLPLRNLTKLSNRPIHPMINSSKIIVAHGKNILVILIQEP
jgi:hypothetical protein